MNSKLAAISLAIMLTASTGQMGTGYEPTKKTNRKKPRNTHQDAININKAKDRRQRRNAKRLELNNFK